jgi:hypothetical protein
MMPQPAARRFLVGSIAAALLSACGMPGQPTAGAMQVTARSATTPARAPAVLYLDAIAPPSTVVYQYTYPHGKPIGALDNFFGPVTMCAGARGILFVDYLSSIIEYSGGKQVRTFKDDLRPTNCSFSATGDLAVANLSPRRGRGASIFVFKKLSSKPTAYFDAQFVRFSSLSYDGDGNLLVDGSTETGAPGFAAIPNGSRAFVDVAVRPRIARPNRIQWDGSHFAVGVTRTNKIHQVDVSGSTGRIVGTTALRKCTLLDFYIVNAQLLANCGAIAVFEYPAGGEAQRIFKRMAPGPLVLAVSK